VLHKFIQSNIPLIEQAGKMLAAFALDFVKICNSGKGMFDIYNNLK